MEKICQTGILLSKPIPFLRKRYSQLKTILFSLPESLSVICTPKEKYSDFTLETEWRWLGEAGNSGIFLLIESPDNPFPRAIECQLKAGNAGDFVLLNHSQLAEYALPEGVTERPKFPVIPKKNNSNEKPVGEWNKAKIVIKEGHISVYINDLLQNEGTSPVTEGHIGLQSEGYGVQFRNISISE